MEEEIGFLGHLYSTDVRRGLAPLQKLDQAQFKTLLQNVVRYIQAEEPNANELRAAFKGLTLWKEGDAGKDFDMVVLLF